MNTILAASSSGETIGIILIIFGAILLLVINYLISREFMRVAEEKGYYNQKYLWITFFLGLIGMLLVIALPDKKQQINNQIDSSKDELPIL